MEGGLRGEGPPFGLAEGNLTGGGELGGRERGKKSAICLDDGETSRRAGMSQGVHLRFGTPPKQAWHAHSFCNFSRLSSLPDF